MDILSQELVDYILDFLHTSVTSLTASSLVCRSWLPTTRYHLFRTPVLYQVSLGRSPKDNTAPFLELLDSPFCTFRHTIQGCVLNIERAGILRKCADALDKHTTLTGTLLIAQWSSTLLANDLQIPQKFSSILSFVYTILELRSTYTWPRDIAQLIVSFPHLESLSIFTSIRIDMHGSLPIEEQHQGVTVLPNLRTLRLRMSNPSDLLHWMLVHPGYTPQIETLDIIVYNNACTGWGLVGALEPFLVANSNTLKDLSLGVQYNLDLQMSAQHGSENKVIQSLAIGSLPHLQHLSLQTHDIEALSQTTTHFLEGQFESSPFAILTLNLVPVISRKWSYDQTHTRSLKEFLYRTRKLQSERLPQLLFLNVVCPVDGHVPSDDYNLGKTRDLLEDILLDRVAIPIPPPNPRTSIIGGLKREQWQTDSLEKIHKTIWGSTGVPYSRVLTRIGTL